MGGARISDHKIARSMPALSIESLYLYESCCFAIKTSTRDTGAYSTTAYTYIGYKNKWKRQYRYTDSVLPVSTKVDYNDIIA